MVFKSDVARSVNVSSYFLAKRASTMNGTDSWLELSPSFLNAQLATPSVPYMM